MKNRQEINLIPSYSFATIIMVYCDINRVIL